MKVAVAGLGFWAPFQIAGWREVPGVEVVAVMSRSASRTQEVAEQFGIAGRYTEYRSLLDQVDADVIDLVSGVDQHAPQTLAAFAACRSVIVQKPMGSNLAECEAMVAASRSAGTWFAVHENWRYQAPFQRLRQMLQDGTIGPVHRLRLQFSCSFPVYDNQPALKTAPRFILSDIGSHLLDTARFLAGEPGPVMALTNRTRADVAGEDVATVLFRTDQGVQVSVEMSYASRLEREAFPQTYALAEGRDGSIELGRDQEFRITTARGTSVETALPTEYPWCDPQYLIVHSSIVTCLRDLHEAWREGRPAETSGEDNLRTMRLVEAAYQSAETGTAVQP